MIAQHLMPAHLPAYRLVFEMKALFVRVAEWYRPAPGGPWCQLHAMRAKNRGRGPAGGKVSTHAQRREQVTKGSPVLSSSYSSCWLPWMTWCGC